MKRSFTIKSVFALVVFIGCSIETMYAFNFANSRAMLNYIKRHLPENPTILEAGGWHGEDTVAMKTIWPGATIHVFEPNPDSFQKLAANTKKYPEIYPYNYALSDVRKNVDFYIDIFNDGACSIGKPVAFNEHEFDKKPITVPATTINIWAKEHGVNHIDFMWLDAEGHELRILKEASDIISTVKAVFTEIDFIEIREKACLYSEVKALLESYGFVEVWQELCSSFFGNALFIKKELL